MLNEYKNLQAEIAKNKKHLTEISAKISSHEKSKAQIETLCKRKELEYEQEVEAETKKMLDNRLQQVSGAYEPERLALDAFRTKVAKNVKEYNTIIKNKENYDISEFDGIFKPLDESCKRVKSVFEQYVPDETIQLYQNLAYTIKFNSNELEKIQEWLTYFDNYEMYDALIAKADTIEQKINSKEDKSFIVIIILLICALLFAFRQFAIPAYFVFIAATLYIRCKEYVLLIKLLSVFNFINNTKTNLFNECDKQVQDFTFSEQARVTEYKSFCNNLFLKIEEAINYICDKATEKEKSTFDFNRAKELAKKNLARDDAALEDRIKEEDDNIKNLKKELQSIREKLITEEDDLVNLKNKIISSFKNLEPSFQSTELLKDFFLGFDSVKEQPVTFSYGGNPTVIFFNGDNNESYDAVVKTLIMMCSQIMSIMSPNSYTINVVDTRTAGSQLSAFQVASTKEGNSESELFNIVSTTKQTKALVRSLYEIFTDRRVRILGYYKDIEDYNKKKLEVAARPESFDINFFFHYDYKVLTDTEELKTLCRIAKQVGIILIFMIDISKIGKGKEIEYEKLEEFLEPFTDSNLFGFNISENSVDIVNQTKKDLENRYKEKKKA